MMAHTFERTPPEAMADLRLRLERLRRVSLVDPTPDRGIAIDELDRLLAHWRDGFDWSRHEARIAAYPWVQTASAATPVRAIVRKAEADAPVVLLLHGWPDSVLRFERLFPLLPDVTLVAPALPGFPFAAPVAQGGLSSIEMADAVAVAMTEFGFDHYVVSAGDVGCDVAEALAARHPDAVTAMHLTDVSQYHFLVDPPDDLDASERAYAARGHAWQAAEGGYMHEQSTRPVTVAVGLGDSPAGLAAWIGEKLMRWTDSDGRWGDVFTLDEALTWISAYWFTGTIGTSFAPYALAGPKPWPRIDAPCVFTIFSHDLVNAPRRFAERFFRVVAWREFPLGGHFAAWERPADYAWGVRRALEVSRRD
ncbi:alpha/beta fold hydrolase [Microbacterium sp. 179-I 3D4 NHS]|uniref:alpha/beta fold hydrolase n=1 Tax=Microbacterium sp. 179-I 3D4 NHS TaxID=3142381 RepID=UPI00399F5146